MACPHLVLQPPVLATLLLAGACGVSGPQDASSSPPSGYLRCGGLPPTSLTEADWEALGVDVATWRALEGPRVASGSWFDGTRARVTVSVSLDLAAFRWERRVPLGEDAPAEGDEDGCPDILLPAGTWRAQDDAMGMLVSGSLGGRSSRDNAPYLSMMAPFASWPPQVERPEGVGDSPTFSMTVQRDHLVLSVKTAGGGDTGTDRRSRVWLEASAGL